MVLESVYPTISEAIHDRVAMRVGRPASYILSPVLLCQLKPRRGIASSDLCPIDHIGNVGCPILVAGGDQDEHTTISETQRMFDAAKESQKLVIFKGARHTDLFSYDLVHYRTEVLPFVNAHLNSSSSEVEVANKPPK